MRSPTRGRSGCDIVNIVVTMSDDRRRHLPAAGFFTRLASIVGALFLLGVILSQPPWLADAVPTMPQRDRIRRAVGAGRHRRRPLAGTRLFHLRTVQPLPRAMHVKLKIHHRGTEDTENTK